MSLEKWKAERTLKKAKKQSIKSLVNEGASYNFAKKLVNRAVKRIGTNSGLPDIANPMIETESGE
jgi:hypothetical protein